MGEEVETLSARYRDHGTLDGLPDGHLIGGEWVAALNRMESVDPGRGQAWCEFAEGTSQPARNAPGEGAGVGARRHPPSGVRRAWSRCRATRG